MRRIFLFAGTLVVLLCGCDPGEQIKTALEPIQKELAETRKVAREAIKAVPGERYLQLIDDAHSTDPAKKAEAQRVIKSIFNVDVDVPYEVSVWFELPPDKHVRADIFRSETSSRDAVALFLDSLRLNLTNVSTPAVAPHSLDRIRETTEAFMNEFLDATLGTYLTHYNPGSESYVEWKTSLRPELHQNFRSQTSPTDIDHVFNPPIDDSRVKRKELAKRMTDTLLLPYGPPSIPASNRRLRKDWLPLDNSQYLFVVMDLSDWTTLKQNNQLTVKAIVHKKGEPQTAYQDDRVFEFSLDEFDPETNKPFDIPIPHATDKLVWARHNMTDNGMYSQAALDKIKEARKIIKAWNARYPNDMLKDASEGVDEKEKVKSDTTSLWTKAIGITATVAVVGVVIFAARKWIYPK